ncbi:GtrA family protein [Vibrio rumoiensis]|uniref:GtrA family protein n=1 Tax=Vibrio rumoiensis TaxID=76258 RepID=UPI003AA88B95
MVRIFNFLLVGGFNTINSYVSFLILYRLVDNITLSLSISYLWAMSISYLLNKYFVFNSSSGSFLSFFLINFTLFILNRMFLELASRYTSVPIEIAQAMSLFILSIISYLSYSKIFKN